MRKRLEELHIEENGPKGVHALPKPDWQLPSQASCLANVISSDQEVPTHLTPGDE